MFLSFDCYRKAPKRSILETTKTPVNEHFLIKSYHIFYKKSIDKRALITGLVQPQETVQYRHAPVPPRHC